MDFAFANLAFTGEHSQQHSSHDSSTKPREPARPIDDATDTMERQEPRRVPSSVYSRSVNHEAASTYWTSEQPPPTNAMLTQHNQKAMPLPPPVGPRMANPNAHPAPGGEFREEHAQIDDMIRNLTLNDEQGDASLHYDQVQGHETGASVHRPMVLTPKSAKKGRRDMSDRSLKSLVPTKATLELLEHIVRIAWDGNLQEKLCEVALAIHKDLRSCFHRTPVTYETANRATHIVAEINQTVDCWLGQMRALQEAIGKINVRRDTPNFMELHKDVHGREIKKFRLMLSPIPTQMGAECNAKIAGLMYRLFYDEVRDPFQHDINTNPNPSPSERTIMSYFTQLGKQFVKAQMAAEHLNTTTLACWKQWTIMSEEIAKQAALMQSRTPAAVAIRAKGAVARMFHHGARRSSNKTAASRASSGRVEISQPIPRLEARSGTVRNTLVGIPAHPLDATGELDEDERQLIRQRITSGPSTPLTPRFSPHERPQGPSSSPVQAGPSSPHVQDDLYIERTRPLYEDKRPSYVSMDYDHPALNSPPHYEEDRYNDPFMNPNSSPGGQESYDMPEYYHQRPDAPSLSDQTPSRSDLFPRSRGTSFSPEYHHHDPRNAYSDNYVDRRGESNSSTGNGGNRFFANYPQYAAEHRERVAAQEAERRYLHDADVRHRDRRRRRAASNPLPPSGPLIEGAPYYNTLTAFYEMDPEKPDPELDPELNEVWHRAMALRRLEGGPPAEPPEIFAPTAAMLAVQRSYDVKNKLKKDGGGGGGKEKEKEKPAAPQKKKGRAVQELRREERKLQWEIDEVGRRRQQEKAEVRGRYGGSGGGDGGLGIGSAAAGAGQGREKMALRHSLSVAGSSGAGSSGYSDVLRRSLRRSVSVGCHSSGPASRSGSRLSGNNNQNYNPVAFGTIGRSRSSSSGGGVYGGLGQSRSRERRQHQQLLSPVQQEFSGIFRDSEGLLIEGNMRDGYRYVDEEDVVDCYTRLESAGYYGDETSDHGNGGAGHDYFSYAHGKYRESLAPLVQSSESLAPLVQSGGSRDPLRQPRIPHEVENPDLFGDVDQDLYATDEEEPWRRV